VGLERGRQSVVAIFCCCVFAVLLTPAIAGASGEETVVVDPAVHVGGSDLDLAVDIAVDGLGNSYLLGPTFSSDFPRRGGLDVPGPGSPDCAGPCIESYFVTKLDAAGHIVYSTLLPEPYNGQTIAVAPDGSAWIGGRADDSDFLLKLSSQGDAIEASRSLPATRTRGLTGLEVLPNGDLLVTGAAGEDFTSTANALTGVPDGRGFLMRLDPAAGLEYATRLPHLPAGLDVDRFARVVLVGQALPGDPATSSFGPLGLGDAVVFRLRLGAPELDFSTIIGGRGAERAAAVTAADDDSILVAGSTDSRDFPLVSEFDSENGGADSPWANDAFVTTLSADGSTLIQSSYLGGSSSESVAQVGIGTTGRVLVAGSSSSSDFPVVGGYERAPTTVAPGGAFVVELNPGRQSIGNSTLIFGDNQIEARGAALAPSGKMMITGLNSAARPSGFAESREDNGTPDAFLAGVSFRPYLGDPLVAVPEIQRQRGARLQVTLEAGSSEPIEIEAKGVVKTPGRDVRLGRKSGTAAAGSRRALKLTAARRARNRVALQALEQKGELFGRVAIKLRDPSGARVRRVVPVTLRSR
jgi:hypothetical protein